MFIFSLKPPLPPCRYSKSACFNLQYPSISRSSNPTYNTTPSLLQQQFIKFSIMHCLQLWITITFYLFRRGIYIWSNIYNFSTMRFKCTICILLIGDYCKLTSREFHVKSMWRTTGESFPRKSLRNGWLKSYIKNYTENTRGINVDSLVILNLKKKIHWNFFTWSV